MSVDTKERFLGLEDRKSRLGFGERIASRFSFTKAAERQREREIYNATVTLIAEQLDQLTSREPLAEGRTIGPSIHRQSVGDQPVYIVKTEVGPDQELFNFYPDTGRIFHCPSTVGQESLHGQAAAYYLKDFLDRALDPATDPEISAHVQA